MVAVKMDLNAARELLGYKRLRMTLRYNCLSLGHQKRLVNFLSRETVERWHNLAQKLKMHEDSEKVNF
jgi:hypothetical protein